MKRHLYIILAEFIMISAGLSFADDENDLKKMDEVVVTGTRFEQEIEKIPANVAIITADDIKKSGAQSVPEILRNLGGAAVRDLNGNGNNQVVDIGGFGETADRHVAVVINGRRVNPIDMSGVRWSLIPVDNIERIEVLYGSGAVLYGDNAMGGVINIITKDIAEGISFDGEVMAGNMGNRSAHGIFNFNKGAFGVQMGLEGSETDGYRDRSEAERKGIYGKIQVYPTDSLMLSVDLSAGESEYQLPGALSEEEMNINRKQALNLNDEGEDEDFFIGLDAEIDFDTNGVLTLRVNKREEDIESNMASWSSYVQIDSDTKGLNAQYVLDKNLLDHGNRLTFGIDYYDTDYDVSRDDTYNINRFNNSKETFSYYLQDEFSILKSLIINAGVRYEDPEIDLASNFSEVITSYSYDDSETAWHLGLSYNFKPGSKVYARVYEAFRYPVVDEFTSLFTGAINSDLKQETSEGYEIGARLSIASKLVINARVYTMDLENEIAYSNVTWQNENLDKTRHQGAEADFRYQACPYAAIYGSVGYIDAEFRQGENNGKNIPLVPEWKYNLGVDVNYMNLKGRVQYNYVGERYFGSDYANTQKKMDDYQTVDLYLGYEIGNYEIFANAQNIFDEKYSDYGYYNSWGPAFFNYYPMPEASYRAGIKLSF
ncbi:MAG: TonB-dependent receptor [Deltaproteobacteria bacterium]|nr:TonB-dependent receptor [Deltaproteobacteria bacterium]